MASAAAEPLLYEWTPNVVASDLTTNWAGNVTFRASAVHQPESVDELRRLVAASDRIRAVGTAHSFNTIADTPSAQVSLRRLPPVVELDSERRLVKVAGGLRYGDVAVRLQERGFALHNLGSLPHIGIAGACATGTHGSGVTNKGLGGSVHALDLVTYDGDLVTLTRGDSEFAGCVVSLGCLGIVTAITLDVEETFDVRQFVYDNLPFEQCQRHFDEIMSSAYSVSLFTTYRNSNIDQIWVKQRADANKPDLPSEWFGAHVATTPRHPLAGMPTENATQQLGVAGPWHERLPHFRLEFTPSAGDELQTEYLIPRERAVEALGAVFERAGLISPVLQISEVRTIAADDLWLSPSYARDSVAIHFTWVKDIAAVAPVIDEVEAALAPFEARPHWGKLFAASGDVVRPRYPRWHDFEELAHRLDPHGKFRNDFVDAYFSR